MRSSAVASLACTSAARRSSLPIASGIVRPEGQNGRPRCGQSVAITERQSALLQLEEGAQRHLRGPGRALPRWRHSALRHTMMTSTLFGASAAALVRLVVTSATTGRTAVTTKLASASDRMTASQPDECDWVEAERQQSVIRKDPRRIRATHRPPSINASASVFWTSRWSRVVSTGGVGGVRTYALRTHAWKKSASSE